MLTFQKLILFLGISKVVVGSNVLQDAYIYASQNREGIRITYSEQPDWSNLNSVLEKNGFLDVGSVCVFGPWLVYRAPNFDATGSKDYAVVSGADNCVRPGRIQSMQPLGSTETPFSGSITFFTQKYFGALGFPTTSRRGRRFFESFNGAVKSMVVVGRSQWTITDTKGKSYCFATNFDQREKLPICLIPDVEMTVVGKSLEITNIHKGCLKTLKKEDLISLEDCSYFGEKRPDPNENDAYKPRVLSQTLTISDNKNKSLKFNDGTSGGKYCTGSKPNKATEEFIMLMEIRLKHDFFSSSQLLWPTVQADVWKTEIIDQTWDIAMIMIPSDIVSHEYLKMIREFMVYHLSIMWKQQGSKPDTSLPERFLRTVEYDLKECSALVHHSADAFLGINRKSWMDGGDKAMFTQFKRDPTFDIVIDTTWVLANMVMAACHHVFDYTNNFWANFIHTFNTMYLLPLVSDWQSMRTEDQFILGGYDYESQYQRLAVFATNTLVAVPNLEPFDRPEELRSQGAEESKNKPPPKQMGRSFDVASKFLAMNKALPQLSFGR